MAQFGKHLFGTSYFGKTSTFDGVYRTPFIDANEPFTGSIRIELDANMPVVSYPAGDKQLAYTGTWRNKTTTSTKGSSVSLLACGSEFWLKAKKAEGGATATVSVTDIQTEEVKTHNLDSSTQNELFLDLDYADYLIKIETTSNQPFEFQAIDVRVANVGIEVRTASKINGNIPIWGEYIPATITYDHQAGKYIGETKSVANQKYVEVKLHLSTSESEASPVIDKLHFSSGDLSKHADNGYWVASLNFANIAKDKKVTFKRVKRIDWKEKQTNSSQIDIRSTSADRTTGMPSRQELLGNSYWKAETAQYNLIHTGTSFGVPTSRISLAENKNGFTESSNHASVMLGPIQPKSANLANTKLVDWLSWSDVHFYPTNKQGVQITYELYKNKEDIKNGYAPIFRVVGPEDVQNQQITLAPEDKTESFYLRIKLDRVSGRQSPVVDWVDIVGQMHYTSSSQADSHKNTLSPLDGLLEYGEEQLGLKHLKTIKALSYNWPNVNQSLPANQDSLLSHPRKINIDFQAKYPDQVFVGLEKTLETTHQFFGEDAHNLEIYSKTTASKPSASTQNVSGNQLFWHYAYDGGTVNFPLMTERDLSAAYTPSLLPTKNYRFHIRNGWSDEVFKLPYSLSWEAISDMVGYSAESLMEKNPDVRLYDNRVPMGYTISLPNDSLNKKVHLVFEKTDTVITEHSLWNDATNDKILAHIPSGGDYVYLDWVSDEIMYDGIINVGDKLNPYVRTQYSSGNKRKQAKVKLTSAKTAYDLSKEYNVNIDDLILLNNGKETFEKGETITVPGTFVLPDLAPDLVYEGSNPYTVEIIPGSVRRIEGNIRLPEDTLIPGSDDEPAIQYTLKDSPNTDIVVKRGSVVNGIDTIPLSNVQSVIAIKNNTRDETYVAYQKVNGSEMGDYILKGNQIDWSPAHKNAKEPREGDDYTVTLIHGIVDTLRLVYTSEYSERMAQDRLWRSRHTVELDGIVTPEEDAYFDVPSLDKFPDYNENIEDLEYIVEDNDLWVETSIEKIDDKLKVFATMNGENPVRNWYPTVQTGFYYLNDQEYYLYSEPSQTNFTKKDIPIIKDVSYNAEGMTLT